MTVALGSPFKLAGPRGDGRHPYGNADGAFIGRGVPLLERDALGFWRPRNDAVLERLLVIGYGPTFELGWRSAQLGHVAAALNDGDVALAGISLLRMQLPPLPSDRHALAMAAADGRLIKDNQDWENEPRVPAGNPDGGQWTSEDGGEAGSNDGQIVPAAAQRDDAPARKERFVYAHLADTQKAADRLGAPVENILAVAALESTRGEARFAREENNFFGVHYPAPFATGYLQALRGPAKVATFASYADSLRSFEVVAGSLVRRVRDPTAFAAALLDFGRLYRGGGCEGPASSSGASRFRVSRMRRGNETGFAVENRRRRSGAACGESLQLARAIHLVRPPRKLVFRARAAWRRGGGSRHVASRQPMDRRRMEHMEVRKAVHRSPAPIPGRDPPPLP